MFNERVAFFVNFLLTLQRNGKLGTTTTFRMVDDLQYSYAAAGGSNQVKAVQDNVNVATAETNDFEEANELATEITMTLTAICG